MKTKITTSEGFEIDNMEDTISFYNINLKEHGFIIDKENQCFYIILDNYINLQEKELITLNGLIGFHEIVWKCTRLTDSIVEYEVVEV